MARLFESSWEDGGLGCSSPALLDAGAWDDGGGFECSTGPGDGPATEVTDDIAADGDFCVRVWQRPGFENGTDWRVEKTHALKTSGSLFYRFFKRWGSNWHWGSSDHKMLIVGNAGLATQEIYINTRRNFEGGPDPSRGRITVHNTAVDAVWECNDAEAKLDPVQWYVIDVEIGLGANGFVRVWVNDFECSFDTESSEDIADMAVGMDGFSYAKLDTTYNDGASITELMDEYVDGFAIDDAARIGGDVPAEGSPGDGSPGEGSPGDGEESPGDGDSSSGSGSSTVYIRSGAGMPRPSIVKVPRGEPIDIPLALDLGSPAPALLFTLAAKRNDPTKLVSIVPVVGSPTGYSVPVTAEHTNREPGIYWWDVWDTETPRLLAIGSLEINGVVRLP